jgi:hypothetical protein
VVTCELADLIIRGRVLAAVVQQTIDESFFLALHDGVKFGAVGLRQGPFGIDL